MNYNDIILQHFFYPQNVGTFAREDENVGTGVFGSLSNGALIHFQIFVEDTTIQKACFKAYGPCIVIAACSFLTQWVKNKTLAQALDLNSEFIMLELSIPTLKISNVLLAENALKAAIEDLGNKKF